MDRNDFRHLGDKQIEENMKDILVIKTEVRTLKSDIKEFEKDMRDVKVEIQKGFSALSNKIIGGMGIIILFLLGIIFGK